MQQSIIPGMLLLRVSMKSFALLPSSPIFSLTCFSSHKPNGVFFSPSRPVEKWNGALASGFGVEMIGGEGTWVGGVAAVSVSVGDTGITGGGMGGTATWSGIFGTRAIIIAIFARSSALTFWRTTLDLIYARNAFFSSARSS